MTNSFAVRKVGRTIHRSVECSYLLGAPLVPLPLLPRFRCGFRTVHGVDTSGFNDDVTELCGRKVFLVTVVAPSQSFFNHNVYPCWAQQLCGQGSMVPESLGLTLASCSAVRRSQETPDCSPAGRATLPWYRASSPTVKRSTRAEGLVVRFEPLGMHSNGQAL